MPKEGRKRRGPWLRRHDNCCFTTVGREMVRLGTGDRPYKSRRPITSCWARVRSSATARSRGCSVPHRVFPSRGDGFQELVRLGHFQAALGPISKRPFKMGGRKGHQQLTKCSQFARPTGETQGVPQLNVLLVNPLGDRRIAARPGAWRTQPRPAWPPKDGVDPGAREDRKLPTEKPARSPRGRVSKSDLGDSRAMNKLR